MSQGVATRNESTKISNADLSRTSSSQLHQMYAKHRCGCLQTTNQDTLAKELGQEQQISTMEQEGQ